jgi:hypothetical protein
MAQGLPHRWESDFKLAVFIPKMGTGKQARIDERLQRVIPDQFVARLHRQG